MKKLIHCEYFDWIYTISFIILIFLAIILAAPKINNELDFSSDWSYTLVEPNDSYTDMINKTFTKIDKNINNVELSKFVSGGEGYICIKKEFVIPEKLKNDNIAILLGKIMVASDIYVNDIQIDSSGSFPPYFFSEWYKYNYEPITKKIINTNGKNTVLIKIYTNQEGSIEGPVLLGENDSIQAIYSYNQFLNSGINKLIAFIVLIFSWYHLIMYIKRPKEKENLYYSIICLATAFYETNFFLYNINFIRNMKISYLFYQKLIFSCEFIILYAFVMFCKEFAKQSISRKFKNIYLVITIVPIIFIFLLPEYSQFIKIRRYIMILFMAFVVNIIHTLFLDYKNKKQESIKLLFFGSIFGCTVIFDIVYHIIFLSKGIYPYMTGIGFAIYLIGIAGIMAQRFVGYHNEIEKLNDLLEIKVEERTKNLEESNRSLLKINLMLKQAEQKLINMAITDRLTGLYNRSEIEKKFEIEKCRMSETNLGESMFALFIDVDDFKLVNDTYGHATGDKILIDMANILQTTVKNTDIVARYGGDEFVVLICRDNEESLIDIIEKIYINLNNITSLDNSDSNHIKISCSIGVGKYDFSEINDIEKLIKQADDALYVAKKSGKNCYKKGW